MSKQNARKKKIIKNLSKELNKASVTKFGLDWWTIVAEVSVEILTENGHIKMTDGSFYGK